ncbi:MAG: ComEC/Rec2 family competence protein, partial [Candidatus Peregrinibacteria bacterium]|nr:ComEC/Rec2 family competence protein [Candidatus Peregrinibacteria bacterium]
APISNLLVAFAIPPAMLFGFVAVLVSFIFPTLALIPAYLAWGVLSYIIKIIEWTSLVPYASIDLPGMTMWMMITYYIFLVGILMKLARIPVRKQ